MTINGVKDVLKYKTYKLDDHNSNSLKAEYYKSKLTEKSRKVLVKLKKLKNYGKKKHILKSEWFLKEILIVNLFTTQKNRQRVKKQRIS